MFSSCADSWLTFVFLFQISVIAFHLRLYKFLCPRSCYSYLPQNTWPLLKKSCAFYLQFWEWSHGTPRMVHFPWKTHLGWSHITGPLRWAVQAIAFKCVSEFFQVPDFLLGYLMLCWLILSWLFYCSFQSASVTIFVRT